MKKDKKGWTKLHLLADDKIIYQENSKEATEIILARIKSLRKQLPKRPIFKNHLYFYALGPPKKKIVL